MEAAALAHAQEAEIASGHTTKLSATRYGELREQYLRDEGLDAGSHVAWPLSYYLFKKAVDHRDWFIVLPEMGYDVPRNAPAPTSISTEAALEALRMFAAAFTSAERGTPDRSVRSATPDDYRAWRDGYAPEAPIASTIAKVLGGGRWSEALDKVASSAASATPKPKSTYESAVQSYRATLHETLSNAELRRQELESSVGGDPYDPDLKKSGDDVDLLRLKSSEAELDSARDAEAKASAHKLTIWLTVIGLAIAVGTPFIEKVLDWIWP